MKNDVNEIFINIITPSIRPKNLKPFIVKNHSKIKNKILYVI